MVRAFSEGEAAGAAPFATRSLDPIGVEIEGLDLREAIDDASFAALRATVVREGLALFRAQPLEREVQVAIGRRFGPLEQLDVGAGDAEPTLVVIGNVDADGRVLPNDHPFMKLITINEGWHTDSSFREVPASFSVFSCVVAPPEGGDTFFASLRRAFETLPEDERARLLAEPLDGVHDYAAAYRARGNAEGHIVGFDGPPIVHPLVRRHPESGRPGLYVSEHVSHVAGVPAEESRRMLDRLLAHATAPERVYRHQWQVGDVMIWDNRSMLHRAQGFDGRNARVMHHVRVAGDRAPVRATA